MMTTSEQVVFLKALERITKAVKVSSEELEAIDDPIAKDYYENLKVVENELDSTIYALEQILTAKSDVGYH